MGAQNIIQCHYKFGVNDGPTADPDNVNFGALDANLTDQVVDTSIHIRIQVYNRGGNTDLKTWQLYYSTDAIPAIAIQVTTSSAVVKIIDDANIADATVTDNSTIVFDELNDGGGYAWQNGYFIDESDYIPKFQLLGNQYTDFQFNIQFDDLAVGSTTYYFFLRENDTVLNNYNIVPSVAIETDPLSVFDSGLAIDSPTLVFPNGGESFYGSTINITWFEPTNISTTTDIVWYQLFIVEDYDIKSFQDFVQIATLPSGTTSFIYNINKNLKGKKCRIGIRVIDHKGRRSSISFSADDFLINNRKLPLPAVLKPIPGATYFSYIPFIFDQKGVLGRYSQRSFYQVYYKSDNQGIDWTLLLSNVMIGSEPVNLDVSGLSTDSDYSLKIEIVDEDNISEPIFINNITINNANYFIIDTIPPRGEIKIQDNLEYTKERDLILSLEASDYSTAVKDYRIEQTNLITDSDDTIDIGIFTDITKVATWNISGDDGQKLMQARFRDYAGNIVSESNETHFRTYKSVDNSDVSAILIVGSDIWIAFSDEDDTSYIPKLYRNHTLIANLNGIPTSLAYYNGVLYISIKDDENKGILQRYTGGIVETVADNVSVVDSLYSSDSVIISMEVFDNTLFLGLENGELLSFRGSIVLVENNDNSGKKSIKKLETDGNVLYIFFDNSTEIMIMNKVDINIYNFSIIDIGE